MGTWEIKSTASAKEINALRTIAEAEAFAHGENPEDVKVVFVLDGIPA
jgi:hypothetical protein